MKAGPQQAVRERGSQGIGQNITPQRSVRLTPIRKLMQVVPLIHWLQSVSVKLLGSNSSYSKFFAYPPGCAGELTVSLSVCVHVYVVTFCSWASKIIIIEINVQFHVFFTLK